MTPSLRRALAHCYLTGRLPSHIHLATWSAAQNHLGPMNASACYRVEPEHLAAVRADPLAVAGDFLIGCGFSWHNRLTGKRESSRSLPFLHGADIALEAYASRYGGGWVWIKRKSVPYQVSLHYTAESIADYALAPNTWPAWRAMVAHLLGDRAPCLCDTEAMTWHAAGRDPIAYAVHVVRECLP